MKNAYVGTFDLAEQRVVIYTKEEWDDFVDGVREEMLQENDYTFAVMSDDSLLECWNDEFFWNYL